MTKKYRIISFLIFTLLITLLAAACKPKDSADSAAVKPLYLAVFVPGVISGSPVYEMLVEGVTEAVNEYTAAGGKVSLTVVEAGTKQADWGTRLTTFVSEGKYDLIISSNPAMPEIIAPISAQFPQQAFLVFDAWYQGNPKITTYRYNQREQAYLAGYIAALVSSSSMKYANSQKKIGLIAGQEYPAMSSIILPGYLEGARAVDPAFSVDFRIVGNWFDAAKASELARAMKSGGVDVIMPIAGGANQGVISAAQETGCYVAWFDDNGYAKAPGYVIASSSMEQKRLAKEKTTEFLNGSLSQGQSVTVGFSGGYVRFLSEDPLYISSVPEALRARMAKVIAALQAGELDLSVK